MMRPLSPAVKSPRFWFRPGVLDRIIYMIRQVLQNLQHQGPVAATARH